MDESGGHWSSQHSALAKSFGYFEDSNSNTMALLRRVSLPMLLSCGCEAYSTCQLELPDESETDLTDSSPSIWDTIQRELERMPDRQILDFLVQYFVYELNW